MWWDTLKHLKFYHKVKYCGFIIICGYSIFVDFMGNPYPWIIISNDLTFSTEIHLFIVRYKRANQQNYIASDLKKFYNPQILTPTLNAFTIHVHVQPNRIKNTRTLYVDRNTEEFWPNDWFDYDILIKFQVPSCGICYLKPLDPHHLPLLLQKPHSVQARCRSWCQSDPCLPYSGWQ